MNGKNGMRPMHPDEMLRRGLDRLGRSANTLSKALGAPVNDVTMILNGPWGLAQTPRWGLEGVAGRIRNHG